MGRHLDLYLSVLGLGVAGGQPLAERGQVENSASGRPKSERGRDRWPRMKQERAGPVPQDPKAVGSPQRVNCRDEGRYLLSEVPI